MASSSGAPPASTRLRFFLDVDIGGHRAAHERATAFVAATSIKYGLSSPSLADLGGSERARVPDLFAADYEWSKQGPIALAPAPHERLVVELFAAEAPNCAANFSALCTGEKGKAKGSGLPLHFRGSRLHRLVKGMMVQGGDFSHGNGAGGESVWGGVFKDEKGALALKLDRRGLLAMSNTGKNSNGSQFFLTLQVPQNSPRSPPAATLPSDPSHANCDSAHCPWTNNIPAQRAAAQTEWEALCLRRRCRGRRGARRHRSRRNRRGRAPTRRDPHRRLRALMR